MLRVTRTLLALSLLMAALHGCSSPAPQSDPRDSAIRDPMNYNPAAGEKQDISGGGLLELDKKALRKDMNDVFSP